MTLSYDDLLKRWGAQRLIERENRHRQHQRWFGPLCIDDIALGSVTVSTIFEEGDPCCGGGDPSCYCCLATSPIAELSITGDTIYGWVLSARIKLEDFDLAAVLAEVVAAGGGTITSD